jgi:hypothetical protein
MYYRVSLEQGVVGIAEAASVDEMGGGCKREAQVVERVRRQVQWRRRFKCNLPVFVDTAAAPRSNKARTIGLDPGYRSIIDFWDLRTK